MIDAPVISLVSLTDSVAKVKVVVPGPGTAQLNTKVRWDPQPFTWKKGTEGELVVVDVPGAERVVDVPVVSGRAYGVQASSWREVPEEYSSGSNVLNFTVPAPAPEPVPTPVFGDVPFSVDEIDSMSFKMTWTPTPTGHTIEWRAGTGNVPWDNKNVIGSIRGDAGQVVVTLPGPITDGHQYYVQGRVTRTSDGAMSDPFPPEPGAFFTWQSPAVEPPVANPNDPFDGLVSKGHIIIQNKPYEITTTLKRV